MRNNHSGFLLAACVAIGTALCAGRANAQSVDNNPWPPTAEGSNYRWSYSASYTHGLEPGDYFTVDDFAGLVPGSIQTPLGWAVSTQNVGITAPGTQPTDDPNIVNLTWTFLGVPSFSDNGLTGSGTIMGFTALSNTPDFALSGWSMRKTIDGQDLHMSASGSIGVPKVMAASVVPEPSSMALLATCLLPGLGLLRRRRS